MLSHDTFIFDSSSFDPETGKIELKYALDDAWKFTETLHLPVIGTPVAHPERFLRALSALHMIGGISYYKTCLPKKIDVKTRGLTVTERNFWNTVYEEGLGEFFFRNGIDPKNLIRFPSASNPPKPEHPSVSADLGPRPRLLVPVGGGKDSVVTLELLKKAGYDCTLLRIGAHPLIEQLARKAGLPLLTVKRGLSPSLFKLNEAGALNGHVPITAYLSFLSIVIAELYGFDAVVMSNERSASIGNTYFHGKEINHQWSKSLLFEQMFRSYVRDIVGSPVEYFSLVRPLSELSIAKLFCGFPQYFPLTTSCNTNWKISGEPRASLWCCACPKCAFVFALFAAFLPKATVVGMFGRNLFEDESLLPLYRELLGLENFKPLECVGTPDEVKAALFLIARKGEFSGSPVVKMFETDVAGSLREPDRLIDEVLAPSADHCIPPTFRSIVEDHAHR